MDIYKCLIEKMTMMATSKNLNIFEHLNRLFSKELNDILDRELHNKNRLNLYSLGEYWAAFDKSAYLLDQMTEEKVESSVLHLKNHPFPLLMCSVHNKKVKELSRNHIITRNHSDSIQLLSQTIDPAHYNNWYMRCMDDEV